MHTRTSMQALMVAVLATTACASAPAPIPNADPGGAGHLALTVRYTSLCATPIANDTCLSVSYPKVCWSGSCTGDCRGEGARSFNVCADPGTRTDDPFVIDQAASTSRLAAGKWELHAISPMWDLSCSARVYPGKTSSAVIDSAQQSCI